MPTLIMVLKLAGVLVLSFWVLMGLCYLASLIERTGEQEGITEERE